MGCTCGKETVEVNDKKYTVKTRLGEGGFSVVDLVHDPQTRRYFALKRIVCHSKEDERIAVQEMEYYRCFKHPNIVECVDGCLVEKHVLGHNHVSEVRVLFPYYKRGTLQDELMMRAKSKNYIPELRMLRLFRQMCEGVRAIHSAQPIALAHRDLKPANVMLDQDDTPVWMDFGSMSKARMEIHKAGEALALQDWAAERCTMPYKAPELFNVECNTSIDERVDIWSLGCCLYAMCYFKSPFDFVHERGDSVALAVVSGNIHFPEETPYSGGLHNLVRSMLEVNVLQRPFIDGVLLQIDSLLAVHEDKI